MIPFTPGHKITFEQLSKDLQDRFNNAKDNLKEIENEVEKIKGRVDNNTITSASSKMVETIKSKIIEYNKSINNTIDLKVREINNKSYTGPTTTNLFGNGYQGQWAKIDPTNKYLFGDNAFDIILAYDNMTQQELDQLKTTTPDKIANKYGLLNVRTQAAFDFKLCKVYIYNGSTWEIADSGRSNEYFTKYLSERSFYLNPITKNLYFYYSKGQSCLIGKGIGEDIGKIIGDNINSIPRDKSKDMPTIIIPPPPPKPPEPLYYDTNRVLKNEKDLEEVGKLFIVPTFHKRTYVDPDTQYPYDPIKTIYGGGLIWAIRRDKLEKLIKTAYGGNVYVTMDKKFLDEAKSSSGEYYIPPITAIMYDNIYRTNNNDIFPSIKKMQVTYEGLLNGQYDAELNKHAAYTMIQNDFSLNFLVDRVNGAIPPRYVIITTSPWYVNGIKLTKERWSEVEIPAHNVYSRDMSSNGAISDRLFQICLSIGSSSSGGKNKTIDDSFLRGPFSPSPFTENKYPYKRYINGFVKNYYNDTDTSYFPWFDSFDGGYVIAFNTNSCGLIRLSDIGLVWEELNPKFTKYHLNNGFYIPPYFNGFGFRKTDKITGEFGINVWTGLDSLK